MSGFVDRVRIEVKAGDGGKGAVSFRREKFVPKGGPDGGDGGRGGDIVIVGKSNLRTLLEYRYKSKFAAKNGSYGEGQNRHGKSGRSLFVPVPLGTVVYDELTGQLLHDITESEQHYIVAMGGRGGKGNAHFASATHQAPKFSQPGEPGESKQLILELKLLADIGLVGFPNSGKSTLISVISAARPKIANYPFTTLIPNLGVVRRGVDRSFVVADIPGLIEGSHLGKGLGIQFLRHVERSAILLMLVDVSVDAFPEFSEAPAILVNELNTYKDQMAGALAAIVATKCDSVEDPIRIEQLKRIADNLHLKFFAISAITRAGIEELLSFMETEFYRMKELPADEDRDTGRDI
jgi:GTPase